MHEISVQIRMKSLISVRLEICVYMGYVFVRNGISFFVQ